MAIEKEEGNRVLVSLGDYGEMMETKWEETELSHLCVNLCSDRSLR